MHAEIIIVHVQYIQNNIVYNPCTRRGAGAFKKSKSVNVDNPTGTAVEGGSVKYSLRDTEKRMRRQKFQGVYCMFSVT